jgi:hypothetical protein
MATVLLVAIQPRLYPLLLVVVQRAEKVAKQLLMHRIGIGHMKITVGYGKLT